MPGTTELEGFRRTFTLLILLVVLPSAGVSGFGVLAIINERATVEKRLESAWQGRLATAVSELVGSLAQAHLRASGDDVVAQVGDQQLTDTHSFRATFTAVEASDPRLRAAVSSMGADLGQLPERAFAFSVLAPQGTYLLATQRAGDRVEGVHLGERAIAQLLEEPSRRAVPAGEQAHLALVPVRREAPEGMMARFMAGVSEAREAALSEHELASVVLPAPLQDFRMVAFADGEDPVAQASARNRWLYGALLALFYVTLALGVVFTGRTLRKEARLSRLKTDFVSLVSHELRTPLTSIRMFIEMLALGRVKDPQEMQTVLDLLSKETARLSGMIEGVLDWARIESGRKEYRLSITPVQELADTAVAAFRAQRVGTPVDLSIDVPKELPSVNVDRDAVAGALLNLLQNAFKYSPNDKRIALRARLEKRGVVIEVEDGGIGIPRRELKKIFERFYRVDGLLSRATEGSGLGLSIAQRIITAHGGRMSVESVEGKGSTFRIHLPVRTE